MYSNCPTWQRKIPKNSVRSDRNWFIYDERPAKHMILLQSLLTIADAAVGIVGVAKNAQEKGRDFSPGPSDGKRFR
jgi:hypothetical protein